MPTIPELGACLNIPVAEVIRMGEKQVLNSESNVFKNIEAALVGKMAAMKAASESESKKKGGKSRVYVQHAVPAKYRFSLVSAFPNFDVRFTANDIRSGAVAMATSALIAEYMLNKFKVSHGKVVAFGVNLKQIIMRNREWVHLCLPGHLARFQVDFYRDDRAVAAVTHSLNKSRNTGTLCHAYVDGKSRVHCTTPMDCQVQAKVGVVLLNKVDTNFRQLAMYMRQHGVRLLYFGIPGSKEMEMGTEGKLPELDAHVFPSDGGTKINVCYKNAPAEDMEYTYANYLELIARTTVVVDGETYHKEFDTRVHGYVVYKITRTTAVFAEPPPLYKSWVEPGYASKYLVYLPTLKPGGQADNPAHWSLRGVPVERSIVDDVVDFATRAQGVPDVSQRIERRLFTRTSNYTLVNQVVESSASIPVYMYDELCLALYCGVFLRKYRDGKTVSTLAPHARQVARLAHMGTVGTTAAYATMLFGNLVRATGLVTNELRSVYYSAVADTDLPLPTFTVCPGFVEYSDSGSSNPRFTGWMTEPYSTTQGFSTALPGLLRSSLIDGLSTESVATCSTSVDPVLVDAMVATGEAYIAEDSTLQAAEHQGVIQLACGFFGSLAQVFHDVPDFLALEDTTYTQTNMLVPGPRGEVAHGPQNLYVAVKQKSLPVVRGTEAYTKVVDRILDDNSRLANVHKESLTQNIGVFSPGLPEIVLGYVADDPKQYLQDGILKMFPNSLSMVTYQFETDRTYAAWDVLAKAIRASFDVSKLSGAKPESFYRPLLSGHVHPSVKDSFSTTFHSVNKRNFNTPLSMDAMDTDFLWERAWAATQKVFYVPGASERLAAMPYIGPSERAVEQWVTKLDEGKRDRLAVVDGGYTFAEMFNATTDTQLMVKKKLKPVLDASYETAVKYPQTIQYDATGRSVAVFSPIIAQKVQREQSVLKPNVLIMQGKSIDDINKFLNNYDWRPDARGERRYIEIDYTQYDKSQGKRLATMYLKRLAVFGVLPDYIKFIEDSQHKRTVSALKAGIKGWLRDQNESGAAFTLDRNNDINMSVIAELLLPILDMIEFVILMGDDIVIAVRGDVNVAHWEVELSRKYNLTLKAATHTHGYICSLDICHLPGGHTRVVADCVKRALMFMDQSINDEEKFWERYVSYCDNMFGVHDLHVQTYLAAALPLRMVSYLPTTTPDAVMCVLKAHAGFLSTTVDRNDPQTAKKYAKWRAMFADSKYTVTH